jgi:phage gp45-like
MKNILYTLALLLSLTVFSQQKTIEITNMESGKTVVFKENQRVKIRTLDLKKWVGNLKFSDSLHIIVNNHKLAIDSLQSIKNQPKVLGTVKTVVLISGLAIVGTSLIAASGGSESALLIFMIGSGTTISAGIIEGLNKNYTNRKWTYKIVEK